VETITDDRPMVHEESRWESHRLKKKGSMKQTVEKKKEGSSHLVKSGGGGSLRGEEPLQQAWDRGLTGWRRVR